MSIENVKFGPSSKYVTPVDYTFTGAGKFVDATAKAVDDVVFKSSASGNVFLGAHVDDVEDYGFGNVADVWSAEDVELFGTYGQLYVGEISGDAFVGGYGNVFYAGYVGGEVEFNSYGSTAIFGWLDEPEVDIWGDGNFISTGDNDDEVELIGSNNTLETGYGGDYVNVAGDNNIVNTGEGNDVVQIYGYGNTVDGGDGDDYVDGSFSGDSINGGNGNDHLGGNGGNDVMAGGDGDDYLDGGDGDDYLGGGDDDDVVNGNYGDDVIIDGNGNDYMWGGDGADVFIFDIDATEGDDVVADYDASQDQILVSLNGDTYDGAALAAASGGTFTFGDSSLTVNSMGGDVDDLRG